MQTEQMRNKNQKQQQQQNEVGKNGNGKIFQFERSFRTQLYFRCYFPHKHSFDILSDTFSKRRKTNKIILTQTRFETVGNEESIQSQDK